MGALTLTVRQYGKKKPFFCKIAVAFSLWLVTMPLFAFLGASGAVSPHLRFSSMQIFNMTTLFVALLVLNIMYWPNNSWTKRFPFHSFHVSNKAQLLKLKQKNANRKELGEMTEEERIQMRKQEEQDRLDKMDPLTRFGVLLKKYEKDTHACMDFAAELRVGHREIDDINAQADQTEAEQRRRRERHVNRQRPKENDKLSSSDDDDKRDDSGRQRNDVEEGGGRRRRRRRKRDNSRDADEDKSDEDKSDEDKSASDGKRRSRRPRGRREQPH